MAGFIHPVDVDDLASRAKNAGYAEALGLDDSLRPDEVLTRIVWGLGQGWFPLYPDRSSHLAVDIGLPAAGNDTYVGANVVAVADGEVTYVEAGTTSDEGYDFGRVVLRCPHPDAGDVYVVYQQLGELTVALGQLVQQGDVVGRVGWHGVFPHVHVALAAQKAVGDDQSLGPVVDDGAWPDGDGAWNVLGVTCSSLDANDWPNVPAGAWVVYNPIEFVRFTQGLDYAHDVGVCVQHAVEAAPAKASQSATAGGDQVVKVDQILQSKALEGSDDLQKMAHDPDAPPLAKGASGPAVEALQRAFKTIGFDLGRFGPNHDGVDGDFGPTVETVVGKFKAENLPKIDLKPHADTSRASSDPTVDWVTLLALDVFCAQVEKTPAAQPPDPKPPARAKSPPAADAEAPRPAPTPPPQGAFVFDGQKKQLSMQFGLRMYKALLNWEWKVTDGKATGCGYSSASAKFAPYLEVAGAEKSEWPDMSGLLEANRPDSNGFKTYHWFGATFRGTGFTNCCNSQLAAMAVALGGPTLERVASNGDRVMHDVSKAQTRKADDPATPYKMDLAAKCDPVVAFEQTFVDGTPLKYKSTGKPLINPKYGGMLGAAEFLEIGEHVRPWTKSADDLLEMRLGDPGHYDGHAWMVGDVRYGVWLADGAKGKAPDLVVDQSGFVDGAAPTLYPVPTKGSGKGRYDLVAGRGKPTASDCDWIAANEAEFDQRVRAFLAAKSVTVDGKAHDASRITVVAYRVFSANCVHNTCRAKIYKQNGSAWEVDEARTKSLLWALGVTRPWATVSQELSYGRYYGPA